MKAFLRVLKYIWFSVFGMAEFVLFIGVIGATVDPVEGSEPPGPISLAAAMAVTCALLVLINIGGIVRQKQDKRFTFISTLLMKLFTAGTGFVVFSFFVEEEHLWDMYIIPVALCVILGTGAVIFGRYTDRISPRRKIAGTSGGFNSFVSAKGIWGVRHASKEYYGREMFLPDVPENDSDRILAYASMPIASYMCWLLRRGLLDEEYLGDVSEEMLNAVKEEKETPLTLFERMDHVLTCRMIDPMAQHFTDKYFWDRDDPSAYNNDSKSYQFDYFDIVGGGRNYYINDFSWEKQRELEKMLDKRFADFYDEYDYPVFDTVYSELFGCEIEVRAPKYISEDYVRACIEQIKYPDKELSERICDRLNDFREEYADGQSDDRNEVFGLFGASRVMIYPPEGEELAYCVIGGGELEEEHGCGFTVKGRYVSKVAYEADVELPWDEPLEIERRLDAIDFEQLRPMCIIPYECGGSEYADNTVYAPEVIAEFKEKCDKRIICIMKQGLEMNYSCEPIYEENRVAGVSVSASINGRYVFYDGIRAYYRR